MKKQNIIIITLVCCLLSQVSLANLPYHVKKFTTIKESEPSFSEILSVVFQHNGLSLKELNQLKKKIKAAPYLPTVYLGYDHSLREREGLSVTDNISVSGGDVTIGPDDNDYNYYDYLGRTLRVRAMWKLDEIVFNRNHFLYQNEKRDMIKLQNSMADDVYKLYEERYLVLIRYLQAKDHHQRKVMYYGKYSALTEKMDAITNGVFHKKWWKGDHRK